MISEIWEKKIALALLVAVMKMKLASCVMALTALLARMHLVLQARYLAWVITFLSSYLRHRCLHYHLHTRVHCCALCADSFCEFLCCGPKLDMVQVEEHASLTLFRSKISFNPQQN